MALHRKGLILGAIALAVVSSAAVVGYVALTGDDGSSNGRSACALWNERASAVARVRTVQLQTLGADVAVFLEVNASARERTDVESFIERQPQVKTVRFESKEDAHRAFMELFADDQEAVRRTPARALPESFRVVLRSRDDNAFEAFAAAVQRRPGVDRVRDDRRPEPANVAGPLASIRAQGFYLDASGRRVARPAGCVS